MDCDASSCNSASEPVEGMEFDSHEAAYSFYKEYAKSIGFGTAKLSSRRSRASGEFIDAKFSCIRYGSKQQSDEAINPRPSPKIGCKASMHVKRKQNERWYVYSFVKDHNHELLPDQAHFFRSHWANDPVKSHSRQRRRKLLSECKQFTMYQNFESMDGYFKNQHDKGRALALDAGDAQFLLEHFILMQEDNPQFFYAVDLSQEHCLRNVFWVDAKGMGDYINFSDVVSFETTYFTNKYKIPLVLFTGVNHHIQPTLFGCALIADESLHTFLWLMQTWRVSMGGQAPRTILTDRNNAIKAAIATVFPETQHCFCLWHVLEKIPRQLDYLSPWHDNFMVKFNKCIYSSWSAEQFERRWWKLMNKFNLRESEWFQSLYEDHLRWVPTFMRDISFAGLSTSTRSESLVSSFDKYINAETSMRQFIEQFGSMIEGIYEEEAKADFDAWHETPELKSPSPFEKQMSLVYTSAIFMKFQVEVLGAAACHLKKENEIGRTVIYAVTDLESNRNFLVEWNEESSDIYCSCCLFEYKGYLCRHAIVVLQMSGVFCIPTKYVLQRWTNLATSKHAIIEKFDEVQAKIRRYNDLCRRAIILGEAGSRSQESYNVALFSIKEAMKQCLRSSVESNPVENDLRLNTVELHGICATEEECQGSLMTSREIVQVGEKTISDNYSRKKGKVNLEPGIADCATEDGFYPMDLPGTRQTQLHSILPVQLHNMIPTMLQNVSSAQLHGLASAQFSEK